MKRHTNRVNKFFQTKNFCSWSRLEQTVGLKVLRSFSRSATFSSWSHRGTSTISCIVFLTRLLSFFIICKCQVNLLSSLLTNVICPFRPLPELWRRTVMWKAFLRTMLPWRQNWLHRSNQFRTVICQIKVCGMIFFSLKELKALISKTSIYIILVGYPSQRRT